jgi:hypothetical protein
MTKYIVKLSGTKVGIVVEKRAAGKKAAVLCSCASVLSVREILAADIARSSSWDGRVVVENRTNIPDSELYQKARA